MKYFVKEKLILFLSLLMISSNCNLDVEKFSSSFLDISSFDDEFGDFNMDDMVLNQPINEKKKNKKDKMDNSTNISEIKISKPVPLRKITKIKITNNFEKNLAIKSKHQKKIKLHPKEHLKPKKYVPKKQKILEPKEEVITEKPKTIKKEVNNSTTVLNSNFISDLLKIQNNPMFSYISNILTESSSKNNFIDEVTKVRNPILKLNKTLLLDNFKSNITGTREIKTLYKTISELKADINRKQMEEENLSFSKVKLEKNYDNINNQVLISQAKLESELNEMKFINEVKKNFQNEKIILNDIQIKEQDSKDLIKRITEDIKEKEQKIKVYNKKLKDDINRIKVEKEKLEKDIKNKSSVFEELKTSVDKVEKLKNQYVDSIKKNFESFDKKELDYLKVKDEQHEIELDIKNQENTEKLLALEIEHLKATNMLENKKIAELKMDLEKSRNIKDYLEKEDEELKEREKITENENKQKQIDYEIKKTHLEEKLRKIKLQIDSFKKANLKDIQYYSSIENDIKNKISYISLQNNNIIDKYPSKKMQDFQTNFIEKSAQSIKEDKNKETNELIEFLNNNNIKNLDDLQRKLLVNDGKNLHDINNNKSQDSKKQIINFLNQISN